MPPRLIPHRPPALRRIEADFDQARAAHARRQWDAARRGYERALRAAPLNPVLRLHWARFLLDTGDHAGAEALYQALLPETQLLHGEPWAGLAGCQYRRGAFRDAAQGFRRALAYPHGQPVAWLAQLAKAQAALGESGEARALLLEAADLETGAGHSETYNRGLVRLQLGRADGWPDYEHREHAHVMGDLAFGSPAPHWDGRPNPRATVVTLQEQGLGDMVFAARWFRQAAERVGRLIVVVPPAMVRLLRLVDWPANVEIHGTDGSDHEHNLRVWPLSIGYKVGDLLGAPVPFLCPRVRQIRARRVALCWKGNPTQGDNLTRSLSLDDLAPLVRRFPKIEWVSVQVGASEAERQQLASLGVTDIGSTVEDLAETAVELAECATAITCDSMPAHLAGALGVRTIVLKSPIPDWHYGLQGDTCPWYPTMTVLRAERANDWAEVVQAAGDCLA